MNRLLTRVRMCGSGNYRTARSNSSKTSYPGNNIRGAHVMRRIAMPRKRCESVPDGPDRTAVRGCRWWRLMSVWTQFVRDCGLSVEYCSDWRREMPLNLLIGLEVKSGAQPYSPRGLRCMPNEIRPPDLSPLEDVTARNRICPPLRSARLGCPADRSLHLS